MRTLFFVIIAILIALQTGCKKVEKASDPTGEEAIRERVAAEQEGQKGESGSATPEDAVLTADFQVLTPADAEKLRLNLIAWAPDYGAAYDKEADSLFPAGHPELQVKVQDVLLKIDQRLKMQEGQPEQISQEDLARRFLQNLLASVTNPTQTEEAEQQIEAQAQAQAEAGDAVVLREAPRVWGEWKSLREEGPNQTVITHNDQYFEFMNLWYEGNRAEFRLIRGGKLFSVDEYKFAYDASKGDLIILDPKTGKELKTMKAFENTNDKTLLYVSSDGGRTKKVYTKVGRAGAPLTPEEKAIQDKVAGFGDGKKGKSGTKK